MANLIQTLISKVNNLTTVVNSIATNAKKIDDLDAATTPLGGSDYFQVSQSGNSKKVAATDITGGAAGGKIQFGSYQIYGASGNNLTTLEAGDIVTGWFSATEFWVASRYDGGDVALKASYTILSSIEDL